MSQMRFGGALAEVARKSAVATRLRTGSRDGGDPRNGRRRHGLLPVARPGSLTRRRFPLIVTGSRRSGRPVMTSKITVLASEVRINDHIYSGTGTNAHPTFAWETITEVRAEDGLILLITGNLKGPHGEFWFEPDEALMVIRYPEPAAPQPGPATSGDPLAIADLHHHPGPLVQAEVVLRRHVEHAVRPPHCAYLPAHHAAQRGIPAYRAWRFSTPRERRCSSMPASQAWRTKGRRCPCRTRLRTSHIVERRLLAPDWSAGNWSATSTGPAGRKVPSTSLPPTRRKSLFATPWVW